MRRNGSLSIFLERLFSLKAQDNREASAVSNRRLERLLTANNRIQNLSKEQI